MPLNPIFTFYLIKTTTIISGKINGNGKSVIYHNSMVRINLYNIVFNLLIFLFFLNNTKHNLYNNI